MGMKNIMVLNDEAHHCYREKPSEEDEDLKRVRLRPLSKGIIRRLNLLNGAEERYGVVR